MIAYHNFSKRQRLAAFLIPLGPETAGEILKHFEEGELEAICREMASLPCIDESMQEEVLEEFSEVVGEGSKAVLGGVPFLMRALGRAVGDDRASHLLERVAPQRAGNPQVVDEIRAMEPPRIFNLLRLEKPQTIALMLSQLEARKASAVLQMFDVEACDDILERLAKMGPTPLEVVEKVAGTVRRQLGHRAATPIRSAGGVDCAAGFLNAMPKNVRQKILAAISEREDSLGDQIKKRMFSFDDLPRLSGPDMQAVMRHVDMNDLALAMKTANEAVSKKIYASMSSRAAESLREEISFLRSPKARDIAAAQDRIIGVVRGLEEEGEITIDDGSSD